MANHCYWIDLRSRAGFLLRWPFLLPIITPTSTGIGSTSFLPSVLLSTIVVTIVGIAVVVVAAGAVVESSSVVKLSFIVVDTCNWKLALLLDPFAVGYEVSHLKSLRLGWGDEITALVKDVLMEKVFLSF
ncbi:hypothetical protein Tco_0750105 [Tanacetum coccineum]|uniref:Uncharacterized protein n=1 Tax=Tanacetum coccineum TaxID=301880 RepID=A0ABQ4Z0D8_9ASTR